MRCVGKHSGPLRLNNDFFDCNVKNKPATTVRMSDLKVGKTTGDKGPGPIGQMKKIVSLVDRSEFDSYVYPGDETSTKFQPDYKPYHNYTQETVTWPFSGRPAWGQRITFKVPWPWQADFLNWIALRLKPLNWLTTEAERRIGSEIGDWVPLNPSQFWIWAASLGSVAIERAELEIDGVIVESFSGDYINVFNKTGNSVSTGAAFDDGVLLSYVTPNLNNCKVGDDGYVYCYLPFAFSRHVNTALPLLSCSGPDTIQIHVTLRKFNEVVRKLSTTKACGESPLGQTITVRDYSVPFRRNLTLNCSSVIPTFEAADFVCGVSHIDGDLRKAYIERPHELMWSPIVETVFAEPLRYTINKSLTDTIQIGLPLTEANGPIQSIFFFLRRKAAVESWADYNNYSATLLGEADPVWNPEKPLLESAQLMVGTAVWADETERWWRVAGNLPLPGGVRGSGNYIYAYNFAEKPYEFDPSGSLNASRVDLRLNLVVRPPGGASDGEWSVHVFLLGRNWIRFENGLAAMLFLD